MTTATAFDRLIDASEASRTRSHGLDRAVQRLAVAMLKWSRTRAERSTETHLQHSRRLEQADAAQRRELETQRLTQRLWL